MNLLNNIKNHQDLVALSAQERVELCKQIREFLVQQVSRTGGHVASNLGVVELTVAIETVFDTQKDRLVFDVGHQSYVHKLLTGRQADFQSLRQFGGLAGFPKPAESDTDAFVAGHASSSVSIALGMARARTLSRDDYHVVAFMGDGAATGGMAYEGLCNAAVSEEPLVVILNDNAMSIDRNVGGMASHLRNLRSKEKYLGMKDRYRRFMFRIPGGRWVHKLTRNIKDRLRRMLIPTTIFESMGFTYLGPVDGHDVEELIHVLRIAKDRRRPVLVHVMTQKGRGYAPAQQHPERFHGIGKFDPATGEPTSKSGATFSDAFGDEMLALAALDERVCAITAAMPGGTGLLDFGRKYPDRLFDVGIAEEHAVSMAGGLAKQGMVPVVALYSTFLQRSYDQILQDVCMLGLHVVFAIDRAGLVGEDGETHHGIYDVGFLRHAPGLRVLCPASQAELHAMLRWAVLEQTGPVAVRYPRGGNRQYAGNAWNGSDMVQCHRDGKDATIVAYGTMLSVALDAAQLLAQQGIETTVLRLLCVNPLPVEELMAKIQGPVIVAEECSANCGIADALCAQLHRVQKDLTVIGMDLGSQYIQHGSVDKLQEFYGIDAQSVAKKVMEVRQNEN